MAMFSRLVAEAAMREKAISWKTENRTSETPTAIPIFPVMGAGMNAATSTARRVKLTTMVDKYCNAFAPSTVKVTV